MAILLATDLSETEQEEWMTLLAREMPAERLLATRQAYDPKDIDVALVANPAPGLLASLPKLRFVQSLWAGVDSLLADKTFPAHVTLARAVDPALTAAMGECVVSAVFSLHRQTHLYRRQQERRVWKQLEQSLAGERTVGILGAGQLGAHAARLLIGLGFDVALWGRSRAHDGLEVFFGSEGLDALLRRSQILVNLLPLTPETEDLLNLETFRKMPLGASLVNLARGRHLVDEDLVTALDEGHLEHAVLDVFRQEPLGQDHPFWRHPSVTVMPHVAAFSSPLGLSRGVGENVARFRRGDTPLNLVDVNRGY
jgi:glyoxylate/hydroxypyruvate reductase A